MWPGREAASSMINGPLAGADRGAHLDGAELELTAARLTGDAREAESLREAAFSRLREIETLWEKAPGLKRSNEVRFALLLFQRAREKLSPLAEEEGEGPPSPEEKGSFSPAGLAVCGEGRWIWPEGGEKLSLVRRPPLCRLLKTLVGHTLERPGEALSFAEIGEILGVSPNTVASRYQYAMTKLAKRLARQAREARA